MRLARPAPRYRFLLALRDQLVVVGGVVVGGIFPPESAPPVRAAAAKLIPIAEPIVRAAWEAERGRFEHELLYGTPGAAEPRGILRGVSPLQVAR